jgi:uncharacterized protein YaeQ
MAERSMQFQATLLEGVLTLSNAQHTVSLECVRWM